MKQWSKSGYKTTEFIGASMLSILSMVKGMPLPPWTAPLVWGLYTIARGLSKMGGPEVDDGLSPPITDVVDDTRKYNGTNLWAKEGKLIDKTQTKEAFHEAFVNGVSERSQKDLDRVKKKSSK